MFRPKVDARKQNLLSLFTKNEVGKRTSNQPVLMSKDFLIDTHSRSE
jgi:hypothetical protein